MFVLGTTMKLQIQMTSDISLNYKALSLFLKTCQPIVVCYEAGFGAIAVEAGLARAGRLRQSVLRSAFEGRL